MAVDDDPQVLAALVTDLRSHYREQYRIVRAGGGVAALDTVLDLHRRGDEIALFVVDERMPDMVGTAFLLRAQEQFPDAKKVLLTAYADTDAAIRSINEIGLDHYLLKPWDPPEDQLYPVLDELLDEWQASRPRAPFEGVRIVGDRWSAATHEVKDFLAHNRIPYRFYDIERDDEARRLLDARGDTEPVLPVVFFADREPVSRPDTRTLAERLGLRSRASQPFYDLVIIGAGPAGLAGAVYGASEGLHVAVLERHATGGQAGTTSLIENYLGFPNGVSGSELARRATDQAERLKAEILRPVEVAGVGVADSAHTVRLEDGMELACRAVLVASGMRIRRMDVPGFDRLTGMGVFYGATVTEAAAYKGERVVVVGGANSAGQAALLLARYADEVVLVMPGRPPRRGHVALPHRPDRGDSRDQRAQRDRGGARARGYAPRACRALLRRRDRDHRGHRPVRVRRRRPAHRLPRRGRGAQPPGVPAHGTRHHRGRKPPARLAAGPRPLPAGVQRPRHLRGG